MQVKCIRFVVPGQTKPNWVGGCKIEIGGIYEVIDETKNYGHLYYRLSHDSETYYISEMFAPYNPYSNSVSKELAEKAMGNPVEVDQPLKELQPQVN